MHDGEITILAKHDLVICIAKGGNTFALIFCIAPTKFLLLTDDVNIVRVTLFYVDMVRMPAAITVICRIHNAGGTVTNNLINGILAVIQLNYFALI